MPPYGASDRIYNLGRDSEIYYYAERLPSAQLMYDRPFSVDPATAAQAANQVLSAPPALLVDTFTGCTQGLPWPPEIATVVAARYVTCRARRVREHLRAALNPLPRPQCRYNGCTMDTHALRTLEFDKIRARLARHTSFSAGRDLALELEPSSDFERYVKRQRETAEARRLLAMKPRTGLGGAHDIRALASKAERGGVLESARAAAGRRDADVRARAQDLDRAAR